MSSSVLEQIRSQHADVELLERAIHHHIVQAHRADTTPFDRLRIEHEVKRLMAEMQQKMSRTLSLYSDDAALMRQQAEAVKGDNTWIAFYDSLSAIRILASKTPIPPPSTSPSTLPSSSSPLPPFTAEESDGRHLDLTAFHARYINFPFHPRLDYTTFLSSFHSSFPSIPHTRKTESAQPHQYRLYLSDLLSYLRGFMQRTRPLVPIETLEKMLRDEFDAQWRDKRVEGWFDKEGGEGDAPTDHEKEEERKVGVQQASGEPNATRQGDGGKEKKEDPLYCKACKKQFAKETVFNAHLTGKRHVKAQQELDTAAAASSSSQSASAALAHDLAELEFCIHQFGLLLSPTVDATIAFAQHKQTLTPSELQAEIAALAASTTAASASSSSSHAESDDDDEAPIHNPLRLPLDWTGKPIPYWLYKLNGLNQTFPCEICGGYTYIGPRQYREHFSQWRHAWGMKCLGVPNLRDFVGVVKMDEVKALWERMKAEERQRVWREDEEEEMEDPEGNVFNKKTYLELQRQGLI